MKTGILALIAKYTYLLQQAYESYTSDYQEKLDDNLPIELVINDLLDVLDGKEIKY